MAVTSPTKMVGVKDMVAAAAEAAVVAAVVAAMVAEVVEAIAPLPGIAIMTATATVETIEIATIAGAAGATITNVGAIIETIAHTTPNLAIYPPTCVSKNTSQQRCRLAGRERRITIGMGKLIARSQDWSL